MTVKTAHIIAHSHWDREWYVPFEKHRLKLIQLMEDLIEQFDRNPEFTSFHLDGQYIVLEDYLEVMPHRAERVYELVKQGKLIVGPWYILQDEFLISSEANARNLLIGINASNQIGGYAKVGYFPDSFGNIGQAPQIISQAGIDVAVYGRGVKPVGFNNQIQEGNAHTSKYSEMYWTSPDGSRVLAILFANWYNNGVEIPVDPEEAKVYWKHKLAAAEQFASSPDLLFMNGCDHQPLQKDLTEALKTAKALMPDIDFKHSSFPEYIEALKRNKPDQLDEVKGELRSQWTDGWITLVNTASARVYIKQANVATQTLLEKVAEPLATMAYLAGASYPRHELLYAWKTLLQNHPHDSICGCSVDEVHREMMTRFAKSQQMAEGLAEQSAEFLASQIDTSGFKAESDRPFVVMNTSGHSRSGVVKTVVDVERLYFEAGKEPSEWYEQFASYEPGELMVVDAEGNAVEAIIRPLGIGFGYDLPDDRFRRPYWAYQVEVELYVQDVPGIGYRSFALTRKQGAGSASDAALLSPADRVLENGLVKVLIADDGSFGLQDKVNGYHYEGLGIYEDTGDIGNEYMYKQPDGETPLTTKGLQADITLVENSPLRAVYRIEHRWMLPIGANEVLDEEIRSMAPFRYRKAQRVQQTAEVKLVTELTLEKGSRSVSIASTINNTVEDHRVRMLFPTGLQTDHVTVDSIYELADRPIKPEAEWKNPSNAQHQNAFVSISDGKAGVTVANIGLNEYEALQTDGTIAVTLLRGVRELGDWGVFPTPEAQCKGEHTLRMKLIVHDGSAAESGAYAEAYQFPVPWTVQQTGVHAGSLPADHELLRWEGEKLAFSALKVGELSDDLFLRVFNVSGEPSRLDVQPSFAAGVYESTIIEVEGASAASGANGTYSVEAGPAKIVTVGIRKA
ncbi:alpha-mannosidase [Paenibacillus protaetiae]|uniref:Alpha-mannosidase n=1 Tax=Paenibacillus protaetiae TaxID=2509456 RepID=A0A4P6F4K9_9BACL|nr:alpha-mannosidase [Paenibacillus protaetiae]QAY68117.1 alpha-mannosidase [Paenibacillus protaetiae]